jgi:hypothetical protein
VDSRCTCQCHCGLRQFRARLNRSEQVGLLTCSAGHYSLLLDSRDYWAEVLQDGRPKESRCRCGSVLFYTYLEYELREDGEVHFVEVGLACCECGREQKPVVFEISYAPRAELIAQPLDPIEKPWLRAKQHQITAYWQANDAERFTRYLVESLGARLYMQTRENDLRVSTISDIEFYPELSKHLYFTNILEFASVRARDPHKTAPLLRLSSPFNIACPTGIALLHYIEYAEEILHDMKLVKQPASFLAFAQTARQ